MSKITVTIPVDPSTGITVAVTGKPGPSCKSLTAAIEAALGNATTTTQTDEFELDSPVAQAQQERA